MGRIVHAGDTFNTAWVLRQLMPADWTIQDFTNIEDDRLSAGMLRVMKQNGQSVEGTRV